MTPNAYEFTKDWFTRNLSEWDQIIPQLKPRKILEIGSYEGRSTCYFIDRLSQKYHIELHCIDTWEGGAEHSTSEMGAVEERFNKNVAKALSTALYPPEVVIHKAPSNIALISLAAEQRSTFDLVFIDGSHQAYDVLVDAVVSFHLLRRGGLMIFDDYLWGLNSEGVKGPLATPKLAIDAFLNISQEKMSIVRDVPLHQIFALKIAD